MNKNKDLTAILKELEPYRNYSWDDKGLASLFAEIYNDRCRYNITAKEWYVFNGKFWEEDKGQIQVRRYAKELANALITYSEIDEKYNGFVKRLGNFQTRQTMLKDSQEIGAISKESLDKNLSLFNCQNGTLNLDTYEFRSHDPNDLLSKISNVVYEKNADSSIFDNFINQIMEDDKEKIEYLKKILGYAMTGETSLETCFIFYGPLTRNGKSTLVETFAYMLGNEGGYALNMKPESLAAKQKNDGRQASGDIARLNGCRFVNASEPPKKMIFDVSLLKVLLGRDNITARFLYENEFQFVPIFKLFINTNFLPLITDDSLFTSGRINVITFDRHFEPHEQDKCLKDNLKKQEHISGIFNWCLDGLKLFREKGALPPQSVIDATAEYRANSDKIGNFLKECLEECPNTNVKLIDVYNCFQNWCTLNGYGAENKGNFISEIKSRNLLSRSGTVDGKTASNVIKGHKFIVNIYSDKKDKEYEPF